MTTLAPGAAAEITDAFVRGFSPLLHEREVEHFAASLPDPLDQAERLFRLAAAGHAGFIERPGELTPSLREQAAIFMAATRQLFEGVENIPELEARLESREPVDLTLEEGIVFRLLTEPQRQAYKAPLAESVANLRRMLDIAQVMSDAAVGDE